MDNQSSSNQITQDPSFEVLVNDYRAMLLCYLRGLVGDVHTAEDLVQESFITALAKIEYFDVKVSSFGTWLRGIARNKVRELRRASARRPLLIDSRVVEGMEEVYSAFDSPDSVASVWSDRLTVMRGCVAKLKGKIRPAIEAFYSKELNLKEAAAELNTSTEAVAQCLTRGRLQIRECVERVTQKSTKN